MNFFVKATFNSITSKLVYYFACTKCKKRVIENASRCALCAHEFEEAIPNIIAVIKLTDSTSSIICTCFTEQAEFFLGKKASEIIEIIK